MIQARDIINIALGLLLAVALIVGGGASLAYLSGHEHNLVDALIFDTLLVTTCLAIYLLNRPRSGPVEKSIYHSKWMLFFVIAFITAIELFLYSIPAFRAIVNFELFVFGTSYKIGMLLPFAIMYAGVGIAGSLIWRCPNCKSKLPFYSKKKGAGVSIRNCPECSVQLRET